VEQRAADGLLSASSRRTMYAVYSPPGPLSLFQHLGRGPSIAFGPRTAWWTASAYTISRSTLNRTIGRCRLEPGGES
jgi:hypothetical protein